MKIGTIAAGVGTATTISLQYVPQYIYWNNATTIQSLQVKIGGSGLLVDLVTKGVNAFSALRMPGRTTNGFFIPLANGYIPSPTQVVELNFVNNVAAAIDIYGFSLQKGNMFVQSLQQSILAGSGARISKFAMLGIPDIAAGDVLNIEYKDGWIQQSSNVEIKAMQSLYQNSVNDANPGWIDNFGQNIASVSFTPGVAQQIFLMRFLSPGMLSQNVTLT